MRLDKFIGNLGYGSRKQIAKYVKDELITVNGIIIWDKDFEIFPGDMVGIGEDEVEYKEFVYVVFNKPS